MEMMLRISITSREFIMEQKIQLTDSIEKTTELKVARQATIRKTLTLKWSRKEKKSKKTPTKLIVSQMKTNLNSSALCQEQWTPSI